MVDADLQTLIEKFTEAEKNEKERLKALTTAKTKHDTAKQALNEAYNAVQGCLKKTEAAFAEPKKKSKRKSGGRPAKEQKTKTRDWLLEKLADGPVEKAILLKAYRDEGVGDSLKIYHHRDAVEEYDDGGKAMVRVKQ